MNERHSPDERPSALSVFRGALAAGVVFACIVLPDTAQSKPSVARCVVSEIAKSAAIIPIHMPIEASKGITEFQELARGIDNLSSNLNLAHDALSTVEESRGGAENLKASEINPLPGQHCYSDHISRVKGLVAAFDTSVPSTTEFWPNLFADGWDPGVTCRAYEKLERGVETVSSWLGEIENNIGVLKGQKNRMNLLSKAAYTMGTSMLRAAETVTRFGGFGGLVAWSTATGLTSYGLFFQQDIQTDITNVETIIKAKIRESEKAKAALETEQSKLRDAATVLKLKHGAQNCARTMDDMVELKREEDRVEIMDQMVVAKRAADQRRIASQEEDGEAQNIIGGILEGFLLGLGAFGGATGQGAAGGGGNSQCAQVREQIQADRNWLSQAGQNAATAAVRNKVNQHVAWYNQNCT